MQVRKMIKNRTFNPLRKVARHHLLQKLCFSLLFMHLVCPTQQQHLTVLVLLHKYCVSSTHSLSQVLQVCKHKISSRTNKHYCALLTQSDEMVIAERFTSAKPLNKY